MGIFDYLTKEKRDQRAFDRAVRNLLRKTRARDERMDEQIHFLAGLGTDEAMMALLRRYDVQIQSAPMDAFERELIHDLLVETGPKSIPPIIRFIGSSENVTWPIRALRRITTEEKVVTMILEVLEVELAKDSFKPDKKVRLLELLEDHIDERVAPVAKTGLKDFDETVRYGTVELLFLQGDEAAREPLLEALTDEEEESQRIRKKIIEGFVETGWTVKGFRKRVEEMLDKTQWVDRQGVIKQKGQD